MASTFGVIQLGRTPKAAFDAAREHHLYLYGHAGGTGTVAEKTEFKYLGELGSMYLDYLDSYLLRTTAWHLLKRKDKATAPSNVPVGIKHLMASLIEMYLDVNGPAVCLQITGSRVAEIRMAMGRKGTWDKVYWIGGTSPDGRK